MKLKHSATLGAVLFALGMSSHATIYYVNATTGKDNNNGTAATSPIQSIGRVNTLAKSGDIFQFARGAIWEEKLIAKSGVLYKDYGSSSLRKPIIRGSRAVGGLNWTPFRDGIFVADTSSLGDVDIQQLYNNGSRLVRARVPNLGAPDANFPSLKPNYLYPATAAGQHTNFALQPAAGVVPTGASLSGVIAHVATVNWFLKDYLVDANTSTPGLLNLIDVSNDRLRFPNAKTFGNYSINNQTPYWLENQLWMLDAENEWYFDRTNQKLYLRLPQSISPQGQPIFGAVQNAGIECIQCNGATVQNIEVRETAGEGIFFQRSNVIKLLSVDVLRAGTKGISLPGTGSSTLTSVNVEDSIREGIWMGEVKFAETLPGSNVTISNSTVRNAGRGYYAVAAIQAGKANTISNNNIINAAYVGILAEVGSTISGNYLENSCYEFGDCAALYATNSNEAWSATQPNNQIPPGYALNVKFLNNIVNRTHLAGEAYFGGKNGIYLDGFSRNVTVQNNFVIGTDNAIFSNSGSYVDVSGNVTFGSSEHELAFQERRMDPNNAHPNLAGCQYYQLSNCVDGLDYSINNTFNNNTFAYKGTDAVVSLYSDFGTTSDFGTFNNNRYANLARATVVSEHSETDSVLTRARTLSNWQSAGQDLQSSLYASYDEVTPIANAQNWFFDGGFESGYLPWNNWQPMKFDIVSGSGVCPSGACLSVTFQDDSPSAKSDSSVKALSIHSTAGDASHPQGMFTTVAGRSYLMTFDAKATGSKDLITINITDGNGVSRSTAGTSKLPNTWQHYTYPLYAFQSKTDNVVMMSLAGEANSTILLDNFRLVEAQVSGNTKDAVLPLINSAFTAATFACPASDQALCGSYMNLSTGADVAFPLQLPARSGILIALKNNPWRDDDRDGIPNSVDTCLKSSPSGIVGATDFRGCAIDQ